MATRVTIASGNFTAAGTWGVVDATSLLDSESANTALTTSYVLSSTFTPGAITIDRICVKLASRAAGSPSNTITVALDQGGSDVAGTVVTINVSDLDACSASGTSPAVATNEGGWYAFKFAAPVTLLGATAYSVKAKLSATTTAVNLFRDGTAGNWSRLLVTTTTGAPAASDILHVIGEHIDTSTRNAFTLTMDNTASTVFGAVANTLGAFTVGKRGTVTWGTAASTNYLLTIAGPLIRFSGSTWNMGTSGTPIPSTSTATLKFSISTNVDGGFIARNGSVSNCYGNVITAKTTLMTADKAVAATVITVASTSGWAAGDELAFAPTSRTYSEHEKKTILTVDSGTQVTLTAGLTYAHSGTSPTQATVAHLTRNVKICGTSTSLQAYVLNGLTAVVNDSYVEFYNLGSSTTNKRGINVLAATGSYTAIGCAVHDNVVSSSSGWFISGSASNNISITYCNAYACQSNEFDVSAATSGTTITLDNCCAIGSSGNNGFNIADGGVTVTNCLAAGCANYGFAVGEYNAIITGTWSNWTSHTNGGGGINVSGALWGGTISSLVVWRNGGNGGINLSAGGTCYVVFDTLTLFGNSSWSVVVGNPVCGIVFRNMTSSGDASFSTTSGINVNQSFESITVESSSFGVVTGIKTAHAQDISMGSQFGNIYCRNTILASATEVLSSSAAPGPRSAVFSEKHDQTAGLHKRWERYGTAIIDTTTYRTASPSETLTPNNASVKFASSPKQFAIANGATATVTVYVNKSASYNGAQPRLIVRANAALGVTADTVLATASGGTGSWLTLSGTTATVNDDGVLEVYVDCDGTAGTCSVDDWSVSGASDPAGGEKYWYDGRPAILLGPPVAGGSPTTIVPSFGGRVARRA